jgi:uncharacterized membrane protein YdbT with pleckstrin-like domain
MSYVEENLIPGEKIEYNAKITRLIYLSGALMIMFSIYGFSVAKNMGEQGNAIGGFSVILVLFAFFSLLKAFIIRNTTELVVTSKRVIYKTGLIRRKTIELNHVKVESMHVDQGIIGRLLDYGTLVINGTGGGKTPIPNVDSPLEFRRQAMIVVDSSQSSK